MVKGIDRTLFTVNLDSYMPTNREEQIKELLKTPRLCNLRKLYRYRSMESLELEGIFTKREIYLPRPIDFNDPFECRPILTLHMSRIKRELFLREGVRTNFPSTNKKTRKGLIKQARMRLTSDPEFIKSTYEDFLRTTGLYCLSEKNDDILMWSHYSNGHRGLCIEFDAFADAAFSKMMLFGQALKVDYSEELRPTINVFDIGQPEQYRNALLTKSSHWAYEEEWRIIKVKPEGGPGLRYYQPEVLTGVIFGALISQEDKQKIMNWIKTYPTRIGLYQAKINETNYSLDIEPI